jgi:type VI secretion system secreted protein VgrG
MSRLEFRGGGLPEAFVVALRGRETIDELYDFEVWVTLATAAAVELDLDASIGAAGTVVIKPSDDSTEECCYHGVVREIELLHAAGRLALMRLSIVPALWRASESRHSRAYTNLKVDDLMKDVLDRASLSADIGFSETHPEEEHIVQYRESDYAFMQRWLEREGCHHFFRHGSEGPEELVLRDSSSSAEAGEGDAARLRFHPASGGDTSAGARATLAASRRSPARRGSPRAPPSSAPAPCSACGPATPSSSRSIRAAPSTRSTSSRASSTAARRPPSFWR